MRTGTLASRPRGRLAAVAAATGLVVALAGSAAGSWPAQPTSLAGHTRVTAAATAMLSDVLIGRGAPGIPGAPPVNVQDYRVCSKINTGWINPLSAFQAGYADTAKLRGAAPVGFPAPAVALSVGINEGYQQTELTFRGHFFLCVRFKLQARYQGKPELPPLHATFLGFGVVPVTATAILSVVGRTPIIAVLYQDQGPNTGLTNGAAPLTIVAIARLSLRLASVSVNGVHLDVGPSCRTTGVLSTPGNPVAPGEVMLTGGTHLTDPHPQFGAAVFGGSVAGLTTIPPFTGCVTPSGENLDPLLTASVSGPGNYVKVTQGPLCFGFTSPGQCASAFDFPVNPLVTVTSGRRFSASAPLTLSLFNTSLPSGFLTITCAHSTVSGAFPDTSGPPRGALASVRMSPITGCTGDDGSTWRVTQRGIAFFDGQLYLSGANQGNVDDLSMVLTGTGAGAPGTCRAVLRGYEFAEYDNSGSALGLGTFGAGSGTIGVTSSTCPDLPTTTASSGTGGLATVTAAYTLTPGGTVITSP